MFEADGGTQMHRNAILGAVAVALLGGSAANSTVISRAFDVKGADFYLLYGDGSVAPTDPLEIKFTLSFDNSADQDKSTVGLNVTYFNLPYNTTWAYYKSQDMLSIASDANSGGCGNPNDSYCIFIYNASSSFPWTNFVSEYTSSGGFWIANSSQVTSQPVPEPTSWAMMVGGFGLIGGAMRARRRAMLSFA